MKILRDYMSCPPVGIDAEGTITDAAKLLTEKKIGCLLVQEDGEYTGMITRRDIVSRVVAEGKDPYTTKVKEAFSKPLLTMDYLLSVEETHAKLLRKNIKRLAVTQQGKVVGLFSIRDLIKA